ncbi:hypothetical protein GGR55DRAFT_193508 [Xylaria sp. FL0064]|nr:hypothetical protein GGR55DRAFT_193508 [Xylaria sp. FL0064]
MHLLSYLATATLASAEAFQISAFAPNTNADGAILQATENSFATQLDGPSTYCPLKPNSTCPKVIGTLVSGNMEAMAVEVPGGQRIYVQADGQVKYSAPHSNYIPPDAIIGGWYHKSIVSDCLGPAARDVVDFSDGKGHGGLALCVLDTLTKGLSLFAKTAGFGEEGCTEMGGLSLTLSASNVGSWEYT